MNREKPCAASDKGLRLAVRRVSRLRCALVAALAFGFACHDATRVAADGASGGNVSSGGDSASSAGSRASVGGFGQDDSATGGAGRSGAGVGGFGGVRGDAADGGVGGTRNVGGGVGSGGVRDGGGDSGSGGVGDGGGFGGEPRLGEGQAHYLVYRPPSSVIPSEYEGTHCYEAYAGIGAEVPLRQGADLGPPALPTGVEGTFPGNLGGPVQDGQARVDGNGSYQVSCMVAGSGDGPYRMSADLSGPNGSPYPGSQAVTSIAIHGAVINSVGKGFGQVEFYTFDSKDVASLPGKICALEVIPDPTTNERRIGPGSASLIFKCEGVTTFEPGTFCYSEGTVILANCAVE